MARPATEPPSAAPASPPVPDFARSPAGQDGTRYSRFVGTAKILLPGAALLLMLVVVLASALHKTASEIAVSLSDLRQLSGHLGMNKPALTYTDAQNRSFLVNARRATQVPGTRDIWQLEGIDGHMSQPAGSGYRLLSDSGKLDSGKKLLDLAGSVLVVSDQGYTFEARSAHVDMNQNRVTSEEPVRAKGGVTSVRSDRFEMWDKGNKLRFAGRVHFVSESAPRSGSAAAPAGTAR